MSELRMTRRRALLSAGALAAAACAPAAVTPSPAASGAAASTLGPVSKFNYLFGFTLQANPTFPVITAKEMGYYKQQNIDIAWDFQTLSTAVRLIGTNQYHAGSTDPQTLSTFVDEGVPLVAVAQMSQTSVRAFAVRKGEGIKRPKDFEGKKVGIKTAPWPDYLAILAFDKADRSKITEIPVGFSAVELKEKIIDVLPIFLGNEPFILKNQLGVDIEIIYPKDFGYAAVGTPVIANKDYVKNNRAAYVRFLRATMKGQEYMIDHRDETIRMAIQYGGTATTAAAHEFIYDVSVPTMKHPSGVGWIDLDQWQKNLDTLTDLKVLPRKVDAKTLVDDTMIKEILKDGKVIWP